MPRADRTIRVLCRAKLNLVLEIIGRRADGYHDLVTVMHPISLADELVIDCGEAGIELQVSGLPSPPGDENVAFRAAHAFYERAGLEPTVRLALHKRIPVEAGLGGGSADAAGVLRGLAALHQWPDEAALLEIAQSLGADIPFFLSQGAALAEGIGERLTALPAADFPCVLAVAAPGVNTGWAYSQVRPGHFTDGSRARGAATCLQNGQVPEPWNGFEAALSESRPDLADLVAGLEVLVAGSAALTGSGSCVFGIATCDATSEKAAAALQEAGYWTWWGRSAREPVTLGG